MSTTYTAWDGNDYEWPPPKDWYQAVDNRWWAPDTGPAAMGADASLTDATTQMSPDAEILNPAAARQHNIAQSDLPAWAKPSDIPTNRTTYIPELADDTKGGDSASILLGIGAVVMTLIIVALIYFIFFNGDGTNGQSAETTATTAEAAPTSAERASTSAENPPTTPSTTTPEEPPATIAMDAGAYPAFEEAAKEIFGEGSTIPDQGTILGRAQVFCDKSASEDQSSYPQLRNGEVSVGLERATDPPTEEQAGQVLDLYLIHFCPQVASQVGLG